MRKLLCLIGILLPLLVWGAVTTDISKAINKQPEPAVGWPWRLVLEGDGNMAGTNIGTGQAWWKYFTNWYAHGIVTVDYSFAGKNSTNICTNAVNWINYKYVFYTNAPIRTNAILAVQACMADVLDTNSIRYFDEEWIDMRLVSYTNAMVALSNVFYMAHTNKFRVMAFTIPRWSNSVDVTFGSAETNRTRLNTWIMNCGMWDYLVRLDQLWTESMLYDATNYNDNAQRILANHVADVLRWNSSLDSHYQPRARTIYVDGVSGNDAVGMPFRTFVEAHNVANDGDTIVVGDGIYTNATSINLKSITVRGVGRNRTTIASKVGATFGIGIKNIAIMDMTVLGAGGACLNFTDYATNLYCRNVLFQASGDDWTIMGATYGPVNAVVDDCEFLTGYDTFVFPKSVNSPIYVTYNDCRFSTVTNYNGDGLSPMQRIFRDPCGTHILNNCQLTAEGDASQSDAWIFNTVNTEYKAWFYINNCTFTLHGTATNFYAINNLRGDGWNGFWLWGNYDLSTIWGPVWLNGNNRTVNRGYVVGQNLTNNTQNTLQLGFGQYPLTVDSVGNVSFSGNFYCPSNTIAATNTTGIPGTTVWGGGYVYICIATNSWLRAQLSGW